MLQVKATAIIVLAANGMAARYIAKYRPEVPIVVGVVPRDRRKTIGFVYNQVDSKQVRPLTRRREITSCASRDCD
eukprot:9496121-Pyramimonas_sp.AAC.2